MRGRRAGYMVEASRLLSCFFARSFRNIANMEASPPSMSVAPTGPNAEEPASLSPSSPKKWKAPNTRTLVLLAVSVISAVAALISNLEKIESFWRLHTKSGLASQFPFTMQISSTETDKTGVQQKPFYREEHLQAGTTLIKRIKGQHEFFGDFGLPALNFTIVNNSTETAIVDEVVFEAVSSRADKQPDLTWHQVLNLGDGDKELELENDGWGPAINAKIENVIATLTQGQEKKTTPPFELVFGKIEQKSRAIALPSLLQEQFQLAELAESDRAKLTGTLSYSYDDSGSTKPVTIPFALGIVNRPTKPGPPAEGPGANVYQSLQLLETDRKDYRVVCPVNGSLEKGKSYQFIVTLCSKRSAIHDFDVIVSLKNGPKIKLGHYRLEFYLPRSTADVVLAEISKNPSSSSFKDLDEATENTLEAKVDDEMNRINASKVAVVKKNDDISSPGTGPGSEDDDPPPDVKASTYDTASKDSPPLKATYPYGVSVPGHPGVVVSPFLSGKFVDVTGFDHNALVQDPYVHQLFLVP
jgi:hypothetical protein